MYTIQSPVSSSLIPLHPSLNFLPPALGIGRDIFSVITIDVLSNRFLLLGMAQSARVIYALSSSCSVMTHPDTALYQAKIYVVYCVVTAPE